MAALDYINLVERLSQLHELTHRIGAEGYFYCRINENFAPLDAQTITAMRDQVRELESEVLDLLRDLDLSVLLPPPSAMEGGAQ